MAISRPDYCVVISRKSKNNELQTIYGVFVESVENIAERMLKMIKNNAAGDGREILIQTSQA